MYFFCSSPPSSIIVRSISDSAKTKKIEFTDMQMCIMCFLNCGKCQSVLNKMYELHSVWVHTIIASGIMCIHPKPKHCKGMLGGNFYWIYWLITWWKRSNGNTTANGIEDDDGYDYEHYAIDEFKIYCIILNLIASIASIKQFDCCT